MTTLAFTEHIEKIPYLLSLYLPVAFFFLAGLGAAWLLWYKHARHLHAALAEYEALSAEISGIYKQNRDLSTRFTGLFKKHQDHWSHTLTAESNRYAELYEIHTNYQTDVENEQQNVGSCISERDERITELEGVLSENRTQIESLQSQAENESHSSEIQELKDQLAKCQAAGRDKDQEITDLKASAAKASFASASVTDPDPIEADYATQYFSGLPIKDDPTLGILFTKAPDEIDDLKKIKGVATVLEEKLHEIGLYRFKQVALWTDEQVAEFSEKLSFPGRIERDEWVKQATELHAEKYGLL